MFSNPATNVYSRDVPRLVGFYEGLGFRETFRTPKEGEYARLTAVDAPSLSAPHDWLSDLRRAWVADPTATRSNSRSTGHATPRDDS